MKKFILWIIIGGIIFGSSVYAVTNYLYSSNEVSYTPSDSSWNVGNVKEALDNLKSTSGTALTDLKNTSIAKAVSANGSTLSSVINTLGTITNQGNKSFTISSTGSTTIPAGYYNGTGKITTSGLVKPSGTKSITSNCSNIDVSGYASVNVSVPSGLVLLKTNSSAPISQSSGGLDACDLRNYNAIILHMVYDSGYNGPAYIYLYKGLSLYLAAYTGPSHGANRTIEFRSDGSGIQYGPMGNATSYTGGNPYAVEIFGLVGV